jgi:hypothetical protein
MCTQHPTARVPRTPQLHCILEGAVRAQRDIVEPPTPPHTLSARAPRLLHARPLLLLLRLRVSQPVVAVAGSRGPPPKTGYAQYTQAGSRRGHPTSRSGWVHAAFETLEGCAVQQRCAAAGATRPVAAGQGARASQGGPRACVGTYSSMGAGAGVGASPTCPTRRATPCSPAAGRAAPAARARDAAGGAAAMPAVSAAAVTATRAAGVSS